jgi:putative transposase
MKSITEKRNNQIKDILHKISKYIIDYCIKNHISKIVIGSITDWKPN